MLDDFCVIHSTAWSGKTSLSGTPSAFASDFRAFGQGYNFPDSIAAIAFLLGLGLGASQPIRADVRVLAATNADLRAAVADRRFREDLLYRLEVVPIRLPTLAERVAEQRLLWFLRSERAVTAHHPDDMPADDAERWVRSELRRDSLRHLVWMFVDGGIYLASLPLTPIPGPNVLSLYFSFRAIGHFLSWLGARHGLGTNHSGQSRTGR